MRLSTLIPVSLGTLIFVQGCTTSPVEPAAARQAPPLTPAEPSARALEPSARALEPSVESFDALVLRAEKPIVVQFHAAWCNHCRALEEELSSLVAAHAGDVGLVSVDIDEQDVLADRQGVDSVPTLQVYAGGRRVGTVVGVRDRAALRSLFESLATADLSRVEAELRRLGPAEPGTACAARVHDPSVGEAGTCTVPAS